MAISVIMPALELAQETGKILSWIKKEGDSITKGEPLVEIETDKITFEVEAPGDGVLAGVRSHEGEDVPVGRTIAWIVAPGEQPPVEAETAAAAMVEQARHATEQPRPAEAAPAVPAAASQTTAEATGRVSPKARRLAKELGVDLSKVRGTGPAGAITGEDVEAAAKTPAVAPAAPAAPPPPAAAPAALSAIARLMAERTTQSWVTTPHFFLVREVDAGALVAAREELGPAIERDRAVKLTHTDLLVALAARVLAKHPKMNASWNGQSIHLNPNVNISVAMAVTDGVVGAVIPNAGATAIADIAAQRRDLTERARGGKLRPQDVTGGTFTISNLGMYGIDAFNAIITPPQAAVLAVGRIADRVVPVDGQPAIRPMLTMSLSSDHRVVDGAQAALFLSDLADAIREPRKWL
jgi:pyruvate dehydrogenase E2 component (dihydrolipoyllysine-residue acetyltransferase)